MEDKIINKSEIWKMLENSIHDISIKQNISTNDIINVFKEEVLFNRYINPKENKSISELLEALCMYFYVDIDVLKSKKRNKELVNIRTIFAFISLNIVGWDCSPYELIALKLKRHRTSIYHHESKFNNLYNFDKQFKSDVDGFLQNYYTISDINEFKRKIYADS